MQAMAGRWHPQERRLQRKQFKQRILEQEAAAKRWKQAQELKVRQFAIRLASDCMDLAL